MTHFANAGEFICVAPGVILRRLACCGLIVAAEYGQFAQTQPVQMPNGTDQTNAADAIEKLKQGNFEVPLMETHYVEQVAQARAVNAIPVLKEGFTKSPDAMTKTHIASALLRLGNRDEIYWDFLVKQATSVIESPDPRLRDAKGNPVSNQLSPEFIDWARTHDLPPDPVYQLPGRVILLAEAGDPRGIPLLRQGLLSPNPFIQGPAAKGLAQVQDKDSIPLMIAACKRGPALSSSNIAEALLYFDDPEAQAAVDMYMDKDFAKALREARRVRGSTPFQY